MEEFTESVKIELNEEEGVLEMHGDRTAILAMLCFAASKALNDLPIHYARINVIVLRDKLKEYIQKRQEQEGEAK